MAKPRFVPNSPHDVEFRWLWWAICQLAEKLGISPFAPRDLRMLIAKPKTTLWVKEIATIEKANDVLAAKSTSMLSNAGTSVSKERVLQWIVEIRKELQRVDWGASTKEHDRLIWLAKRLTRLVKEKRLRHILLGPKEGVYIIEPTGTHREYLEFLTDETSPPPEILGGSFVEDAIKSASSIGASIPQELFLLRPAIWNMDQSKLSQMEQRIANLVSEKIRSYAMILQYLAACNAEAVSELTLSNRKTSKTIFLSIVGEDVRETFEKHENQIGDLEFEENDEGFAELYRSYLPKNKKSSNPDEYEQQLRKIENFLIKDHRDEQAALLAHGLIRIGTTDKQAEASRAGHLGKIPWVNFALNQETPGGDWFAIGPSGLVRIRRFQPQPTEKEKEPVKQARRKKSLKGKNGLKRKS